MTNPCHIRDFLSISKDEMKGGKIPTKTLCGLDDPEMKKLTYGDPDSVAKGKIVNSCFKCKSIWTEGATSLSSQKKARHLFQKALQKAYRGGH